MLQRLADMPEVFVSVITGRCLPDIKAKVIVLCLWTLGWGGNPINQNIVAQVNIKNITYAGNHGLDIVHPDGTKFVPPLPEEVNLMTNLFETWNDNGWPLLLMSRWSRKQAGCFRSCRQSVARFCTLQIKNVPNLYADADTDTDAHADYQKIMVPIRNPQSLYWC